MEFDATFIVSIVSFILFVLIMNKILYKPILDIIEKRKLYFEENKDLTQTNNNKTQAILEACEEKISSAKNVSRNITSSGLLDAKTKKDEIIKNAKDISFRKNKEKINKVLEEKEQLKEELNSKTDELSDLIVSKILKEGKDV
ncbi:MAG: ATP synthase F0 subunit B [Cyanobacteria bacterium SIG30]|nr:ATP synthase F0 subunit B [Cyanobacteria bacterium SIG30]